MTTAEQRGVRVRDLHTVLARGVIIAKNWRKGALTGHSIPLTIRPEWSNTYANTPSLIGGKVELEDCTKVVPDNEVTNSDYTLTPEELVSVTLHALIREILEENELDTTTFAWTYLGLWRDGKWLTLAFYCLVDSRPRLSVDPDSDGIVWMNAARLAEGNTKPYPQLLPSHLEIAQAAVQAASAAKQGEKTD